MFTHSKKHRSLRQTFAFLLSMAMIVSNLSIAQVQASTGTDSGLQTVSGNDNATVSGNDGISDGVSGGTGGSTGSSTATTDYILDATALDATGVTDKDAVTEGTVYADYFKVIGKVTQRTNSNGTMKALELDKALKGTIQFTVTGTADVELTVSSTGGSNTSAVALLDGSGNVVASKEGTTHVSGTSGTTLTYSGLAAGTYQVGSPEDPDNSRGVRLLKLKVSEAQMVEVTENAYVLDATALDATGVTDKDAVTEGTVYADYFKVIGKVTQRTNSDGTMKALELDKALKGTIQFTVTGTADVELTVSSTGGSNTSAVALLDESGNVVANQEGTTHVSGTSGTTLTYSGLAAGTYQVGSPEDPDNSRGVRLLKLKVKEETQVTVTETKYTLDATALDATGVTDKDAVTEGTVYADYFKVIGKVTQRTNSDGTMKALELDKATKGAIQFTVTGTADVVVNVSSTGGSNTSAVAIIDADGNVVANNEGISLVSGTSATTMTYTGLTAGTYQLVSPENADYSRGCRLLSITVTELTAGAVKPPRAAWGSVAAPVITEAKLNEKQDGIDVSVSMVIGYDGADKIEVSMLDSTGEVLETKTVAKEGEVSVVSFVPDASGDYVFHAVAIRDGEENKSGENVTFAGFVLPLKAPVVSSATCLGGGKVSIVWGAVKEADKYIVSANGTAIAVETTNLTATLEGLTVDQTYTFSVVAVRGSEQSEAGTIEKKVVDESQRVWSFAAYGSSTNTKDNGYIGDLNSGSVTIFSENGKGKLVPNSTDGIAFYYTEIPASMNFTLKGKIKVDSWTLSNAQEGFGIMAADTVGTSGDSSAFWTNSYMGVASKVEYKWDGEKVSNSGDKITMKLGIAAQEKIGVTKENLAKLQANDTATVNNEFKSGMETFETSCAAKGVGTYNIIGNATKAVEGTVANPLTELTFQIQKNNSGYFISYFDAAGRETVVKYYDTEALSQLDEDTVYVGFFASRNARITVSEVELTEIDPSDDGAAEERPITKVDPLYTVESASNANSEDYELAFYANADGVLTVTGPMGVLADKVAVTADTKKFISTKLDKGANTFTLTFTPNADYKPSEYEVMSSYETTSFKHVVNYKMNSGNLIYISPNGKAKGKGTKEDPMDIYTAVAYAAPGQKLLLMEGTYSLYKTVNVSRGIDGTADQMIYLMADPEAKGRPVFDFNKACAGMVFAGDYWYIQGFDVTNSANAQKGVQISGSNNVVDDLHTYRNGNTGIQISRLKSTDLRTEWPANNLVLNCTSYLNADPGYEDADGFAAKLTVGEGNVFDGCIAAYNADDGWDLFAKVETGAIGSVTIKNSVAFKNGYDIDANGKEINAGNGNGFKMGGEGITGNHKLINSIAFGNKAKGIDSNSCPDIKVENSTSVNNGSYNVAFYSKNTSQTDFAAKGILSFKANMAEMIGEEIKPLGTQNSSSAEIYNATNYYFDGTESKNSAGAKADISWFQKYDVEAAVTGIGRNADGTINMNGYFELTSAAAADAGARMSGTATKVIPAKAAEKVLEDALAADISTPAQAQAVLAEIAALPECTWEGISFNGSLVYYLQQLSDKIEKQFGTSITIEQMEGSAIVGSIKNAILSIPAGKNGKLVVSSVAVPERKPEALGSRKLTNAVGIDLKLYDEDGNKCQLDAPVVLQFTLPYGVKANQAVVIHYWDEKNAEVLNASVSGNTITFVANSFSTFVIGNAEAPAVVEPSTQPSAPAVTPAPEGTVTPSAPVTSPKTNDVEVSMIFVIMSMCAAGVVVSSRRYSKKQRNS